MPAAATVPTYAMWEATSPEHRKERPMSYDIKLTDPETSGQYREQHRRKGEEKDDRDGLSPTVAGLPPIGEEEVEQRASPRGGPVELPGGLSSVCHQTGV